MSDGEHTPTKKATTQKVLSFNEVKLLVEQNIPIRVFPQVINVPAKTTEEDTKELLKFL